MSERELLPLVEEIAREEDIPPGLLVGVVEAESRWESNVVRFEAHLNESSVGLTQVLPSTAREHGWDGEADLREPRLNLTIGARYLLWCWDRFGEVAPSDRWCFAVACYNAGRGNINRALARAREAEGLPRSLSESRSHPFWAHQPPPPRGAIDETPAAWRRWAIVAGHLAAVTGRDNAGITVAHVARVVSRWARYDRERIS